jgi:glycosyltransferase involved in cell wall biosynthesis
MFTVLHTEASTGWGGQEIRIVQEAIRFAELGYRVLIAYQEGGKIGEKSRIAGLPVYPIRLEYRIAPLVIRTLLRIIKNEKVDILHTHSSKDSWLAGVTGRIAGIPVVRSRHLSTPVRQTWLATFVYRYLADVIITSGIHIKEALITRNGLNPEKIISIPAGVDIKRFDINIKGDKIRTEFGVEDSYPIVGTVAILRSWKGLHYLLDAVSKVASIFPQAKIIIVGDGPQWNNLHRQIQDLGIDRHVIMTGFRDDIPEIMSALDIFVLPSIASEATSQVIPQALAMGKPVIATNTGGLPEIIEDGVTGLLIPPENPDPIANAIIRMAREKEEAKEMAARGKDKTLKNFTFQKMIDRTAEVYYNVLDKKI